MPLRSPLIVDTDDDSVVGVAATKRKSPSGGGPTRVGSLAMRNFVVSLLLCLRPTGSSWIFSGIPAQELDEARDIGRKAKVDYLNNIVGQPDHLKRNSLYLDGLEQCNNIDRNWTDHIQNEALQHGNVENAVWLEKAGMKMFTSLFMTLPEHHMSRIAKAACAKHEKQLTCGAEFEGAEITRKRIDNLKTIGNHKMMFEKECNDIDYVTTVYPCVGRGVDKWIRPCAEDVNAYSTIRDSVNQRIGTTYDTAVEKVKALKGSSNGEEDIRTFTQAMDTIVHLEGTKCGLFRKMRVCVLRQILDNCGVEAMKAFNTSISLGYLRTERLERLNLDFEVFNYPVHPNCVGL
ncbi:unnamed protein product [Cylicocyclus nassatus]|uniref:Uncharacterized protein n=1 Tax=Cylicocyclus nassatus TaxID=53992 RepID=A0AA36DTP1_CYLNA|nr:unnamed protein product [Cylicocyclus nassatus]